VKEIPTNFRLVSATNRSLPELVEAGTFRGDLFYRINAIILELPPLRERPDDILLLARQFLDDVRPADAGRWSIAPEAVSAMTAYPWPGNVRELRNVVERAALLSQDRVIRSIDLGSTVASGPVVANGGGEGETSLPSLRLEELERLAIEEALERTGWHQGQAAELLGISDRTLHRKIRGLGLKRPE
jgi:DNA-binding NtrC family response regulator